MSVRCLLALLIVVAGAPAPPMAAQAPGPVDPFATELQALVNGAERYGAGAIGLTASSTRIVALEPIEPPVPPQRRLVIVGGLDGSADGAQAVVDFLRGAFARRERSGSRWRWQLAAVPCALPDSCGLGAAAATSVPATSFPPDKGYFDAAEFREARYLWRWVTMLGPDLVIEVRSGPTLAWRANGLAGGRVRNPQPAAADSFVGALGTGTPSGLAPVPALQVSGPRAEVVAALRLLVRGLPAGERSPLRQALEARTARQPIDVAKLLASRYPASPIMSYIPALSWIGGLKVSALTSDPQYRDRVRTQVAPFISGAKPAIAEPYQLTSLAGHQALADLATLDGNPDGGALARKAADFILADGGDDPIRFATHWTDDMFMATSVLARVAADTGEAKYATAVGRLLTTYAQRLQRADGLFVHAESGPHAWGRGNGFAAFGLIEALTHLPDEWPARQQVLATYQRLMGALQRSQAPDGAWHQVIDEPGTYREFTATAMITTAMAGGIRLGWLDRSRYGRTVDVAWRAVLARVSETGELVDVCTGTGAGQNATRAYYLNRPAIFGPDDRGGAMALTAALEIQALRAGR